VLYPAYKSAGLSLMSSLSSSPKPSSLNALFKYRLEIIIAIYRYALNPTLVYINRLLYRYIILLV
jgi:hypothetical protein